MATTIRPKLSKKNKYYVEKHRYYELKHFCLQYPIWKQEYLDLDGYTDRSIESFKSNNISNHTATHAEKRLLYFDRMRLVEQAALSADGELADYILKAVTEGRSYNYLKSRLEIPCGKDLYYDRYRRFFWLLDKTRN